MNSICGICKNRILSHSRYIKCSHCNISYHIRCLPNVNNDDTIFTDRDNNTWYCMICIDSVLPFSHIQDDVDFYNAIADQQSNTVTISFEKLDEKLFIPFEINDDSFLYPDLNYFNSIDGYSTRCNYHFQDSFNRRCRQLKLGDEHFLFFTNIYAVYQNII